MYEFRDWYCRENDIELLVHINHEGKKQGVDPATNSSLHTHIMKTESLLQALDHYRFDAAFGGARRDEEKSRAKERVFSFRDQNHQWDAKNQRPELWNIYNTRLAPGEEIRVFPLSNWTELDVWQYTRLENIPIVPLYFAAERPVVQRQGTYIMLDDDRLKIHDDEVVENKMVRFRTLGCYPLTGAIESEATDIGGIIAEMLASRYSERQGRLIDSDEEASMEKKKARRIFLIRRVALGGIFTVAFQIITLSLFLSEAR